MAIIPQGRRSLLIQTAQEVADTLKSNSKGGLEFVLAVEATSDSPATAWIPAEVRRSARLHPWDEAHAALADATIAGLETAAPIDFVEPDFVQAFPVRTDADAGLESADVGEPCRVRGIDPDWPPAEAPFGWHLGDEYSGLKSARELVGESGNRLLVGILDTGYDPGHATLPAHLRVDLARNFTGDGGDNDAIDPASTAPFTNPGHGTATLALLAGKRINPPQFPHFNDFLGGAPHVDVVPIRIADSVVHFRTSAMAAGIEYAATIGCQVLSISMGGAPSSAWAAAVNRAYNAGVAIFAAAGNRIGPLPPKTLVYPARFERVVAVCGFTAAKEPYYLEGFHRKMHGCFGPKSAMATALAAYTPNMPWAAIGCGKLVNPDGAGTSSATPQAAAAAALWLQRHAPNPSQLWRRVEAVRHALFKSADRSPAAGIEFFGNGLLRAHQALGVPFDDSLPKAAVADVSFPWLRLLGALEAAPASALGGRQRMFETEALQLYLTTPRLQALTGGADPHQDQLDERSFHNLIEALSHHRGASKSLQEHARRIIHLRSARVEGPASSAQGVPVSSYELASSLFRTASAVESIDEPGQDLSNSLKAIGNVARKVIVNPRRRCETVTDLVQAMREIKAESSGVDPKLMTSPPHRLAAILQTVLGEHAVRASAGAGLEFAFDGDDIRSVMEQVLHRAANVAKHPPARPDSSNPETLADRVRICLVGDFGTGLYGAPVTAATIAADPGRFDLLVHLGDVYYSGEPHEVQTRLLDIWPDRTDAISRSLNGNHDMYSGGYGYFDLLLPKFGQASSYFSMQNAFWTLLFLDTAYKDNNLDKKQVKWIEKVVAKAGNRKIVLLSHHPLFSNFKPQGVKLASKLHDLLESRRITAWYWGHEHHCVIYEPHPEFGLRARCLGNGGMPAKRKDLEHYQMEREIERLNWRRIMADLTPSGLILDGPNVDIPETPEKYLPHAFAIIELKQDRLEERIFSPRGKLLYSGEIH